MKIKNKKSFLKYILTPLFLLGLWFILTAIFIIKWDTSLSVISFVIPREDLTTSTFGKMHKGDILTGKFKSPEDNLGILSIKFVTFNRPPYKDEDIILFRIKEEGEKSWYYHNTYRDGLIYDVPTFPFGFPEIKNSKGKVYIFEIKSLNGNDNNSVALSNKGQIIFGKYHVDKTIVMHDKKQLIYFAIAKFINSIETTDVKFSSFIYLLPFIFYIIWISPLKEKTINPFIKKLNVIISKLEKNNVFSPYILFLKSLKTIIRYNLHWFLLIVVLTDIFIIQLTNDITYLVIIFLWIAILRAYKLESKASFIIALVLLIIPPIFFLLKDQPTAEKGTVWAYMFLVAGTIQALLELKQAKIDEKA